MRSIIGEDEYAQMVASVAASFPAFATFNADVSVVVIDDDNEDEGRTSSPCPSSTSSKDRSNSS